MNATATPPPVDQNAAAAACLQQVHVTTGILIHTITGESADAPARAARYTAMALIYQVTGITVADIGGFFRRDIAAVKYALDRVRDRLVSDPVYARQYAGLVGKRTVTRRLPAPRSKCGVKKLRDASGEKINAGGGTFVSASTHGRVDQLGESTLRRQLITAEEDLTYWQGKKFRALDPREKADAGARVQIWQAQVDAIQRRLRELNRTEAHTA